MTPGEQRAGGLTGNVRNNCERTRIFGLGGTSDHADNMDNPSSREDISEMYVQNINLYLLIILYIFTKITS